MSEPGDPAIKLFGITIPMAAAADEEPDVEEAEAETQQVRREAHLSSFLDPCSLFSLNTSKGVTNMEVNNDSSISTEEENEGDTISLSGLSNGNEDDHKTSFEDEKEAAKAKTEHAKSEADGSVPETVLKKPDKILPCPRCNSMETKFCYYNNYKFNQPRHFCKNCQRYWTAGGTMRNVPAGAGRRKSKHSNSQDRNIAILSDGFQSFQSDTLKSTHHRPLPCVSSTPSEPLIRKGTVKSGQEVPLCEYVTCEFSIREQGNNAASGSMICGYKREEPSCSSSVIASNFVENRSAENAVHVRSSGMRVYCNGLAPLPHLQYYPEVPWAYPWSPAWNSVAAMEAGRCSSEYSCAVENGNSSSVSWSSGALMAASPFCASTLPFSFMPAPFLGYSILPNGTWNVPCAGSNDCISASPSTSYSGCSGNGSPTLGKHSRDYRLQGENNMKKPLWVPKTLRMDDPEEASKSSIWATLGIKPEMGSIFQSKSEQKAKKLDGAQLLHENPAAVSRSHSFQEST
ncbi:hypothetical protein B296_00037798 [Ensete ventricosum]|uniref:Dof-type domain-containing protein n=1 Tax=Ensete ventricosum TaxID=4639 RepID=A0A426ZQ35_ENSVE|nr:hypothetical protein B296_00037798 [Ensete ventricosum]